METQELTEKIKSFLIPNVMNVAYVGCIKRGMSKEQISELKNYFNQLWEKVGKDNRKFNELISRSYDCLNYEITNYFNFDRNK